MAGTQTSDEDEDSESIDEEQSDYGSDYDEFAEFNWLEQMDGLIMLKSEDGGSKAVQVAYCDAKLIRRRQIRTFWSDMEEPTQETSSLAFDLFDRFGRLKTDFKTHPVKSGTGVWGDELDQGDLLLIETLRVQKDYRRCGLGRKLVNAVLERARAKSEQFFAVLLPS
jgi:GNAT superfamily N-acetyltransferase